MAFPSLVPVQKVPSPTSHSDWSSSSWVQVCSQTFGRYESRFIKVQPPLLQLTLQPRQRMLPQLPQLPSTYSHSRRSHYRHLEQVVSNRRCLQKLRCWCLHSQDIWSHDATLCQVGFHKVLCHVSFHRTTSVAAGTGLASGVQITATRESNVHDIPFCPLAHFITQAKGACSHPRLQKITRHS